MPVPEPIPLFDRYRELQSYVAWTDEDAQCVQSLYPFVEPHLLTLIDDFYEEIQRHPFAAKVVTGGQAQIDRLKGTLVQWLRELFSGRYDQDYVERRWRVGWRHVEIGLDQLYTNVALSRLRSGLIKAIRQAWQGEARELVQSVCSLNKLLDLDLTIIEDAYHSEYLARQQVSERLAAIGQVAGGVAHELRNPLNVIKTSVYFLLHASHAKPEKVAEHLHRIEQHVTAADGVITALSNFAKMPLPDLRPFSVESCVRETLLTNALPPTVELQLDFPPGLPSALGDKEQLRIVFANLIRNARDAMPAGGRLFISASQVDNGIDVAVRDTGVGIPPESLNRVMEPLFSTKARGIGLGLALAKAIVERSRGRLNVISEHGHGSTFTVRLLSETKEIL